MSEQQSPVLNVSELVDLMGGRLSRAAVYQAIREGTIPSIKIGRRRLLPRKAVMSFLEGEGWEPRGGNGHDRTT
ncbi:MAG: helix-turn-helix domain-containing protein [Chloroflexi bacterium]|nr:helix-turn-helix domain-containing protein [Chloroflexota bacterium]